MAPKRKTPGGAAAAKHSDSAGLKANDRSADAAVKKIKSEEPDELPSILKQGFYPPEMSSARCKAYNDGDIPRPIELVENAISSTKQKRVAISPRKAVLHWFKRDLRISDNRGLSMAAEMAKKHKIPLICLFLVSPEDYTAHFVSPARVDFELRTMSVLQNDLAKLDIPLVMDTVPQRKNVPNYILKLCQKHDISHVFCNIEYEVDELRREAGLVKSLLDKNIAFLPNHDDLVVAPGQLKTGQGKQYAVYSPWFRSWVRFCHENPQVLEASPPPSKNPASARKAFASLFDCAIPSAPDDKKLKPDQAKRLRAMWPAGEHEASARLDKFIKEKISGYGANRNFPASQSTSSISVHHSSGTLSPRTSIRRAREANTSKSLDSGIDGICTWVSEVAWRDFYKHVLAHWPYVCMHKPFKYEYANVQWEYNDEHFEAWTQGRTGYPIVDAAMRQLNHSAYMHNRCRMIVASFLSKDLLLDWRMGEAYFHNTLIDCDFANNNGGWGFSASVGVDPQPYFRIFNPLLQSEKFDADGEYIRRWVPELKDVEGKAIHDPYGRGASKIAEKNGYPKPIVVHKECRERALARYKEATGRSTA
jgi:deoxyribodipyrimidine photo-lyase